MRSVQIVGLAGRETPPSMTVELQATGIRYIEDRTTTTVISGDRSVASSFAMRWRMELTGEDDHPWRIAAIGHAGDVGRTAEVEPAR